MTYKDMTFCSAHCGTESCYRNNVHIPNDLPVWELVAMADFQNSCSSFSLAEDVSLGDMFKVSRNLLDYQDFTDSTAIYPYKNTGRLDEMSYLALGLGGEAGEVLEVCKKIIRDIPSIEHTDNVRFSVPQATVVRISSELGDVFWYWIRLCKLFGLNPYEVVEDNVDKLEARNKNGTIQGSGNHR